MAHPERIVPDETSGGILALHLKRYDFARAWCDGRTVLDAACGVGYGTAYLAERAAHVTGVDIDASAVDYARARYGGADVSWVVGDVTDLPFEPGSFDVVCSFETVEHVPDPERAIAEAARVLRPDGVYVMSTPRVATTTRTPENPFHCIELSIADLSHTLSRHFAELELYGERRLETARHRLLRRLDVAGLRRRLAPPRAATRLVGSAPTAELRLDDLVIDHTDLERADVVVAVCRQPRR